MVNPSSLTSCSRQSANVWLSKLEQKGLIQLQFGKCGMPKLTGLAAFADAEKAED